MKEQVVTNGIHTYTDAQKYVPADSPAVREHIQWFMGLKLGIMMHWAPGCQLGTYESWPLSDGDGSWSQEDVDWTDIPTFKEQYRNANKTFNPVKFRPDRWAALAKECGFRYLLFTNKHHDGFCMFDTDTTDYKITHESCPFHTSPYADIAGSLYDAFRKEGLAISAYFSKPDWNCDYYWHREFGTAPSRNVNYNVIEHPELWEKFIEFTHRQILELGRNYGKIDVLWLDGGWVSSDNLNQDIHLEKVVETLRSTTQPHLIVCDRCVGGPYENIITPEKQIPDQPLFVPWETCATIGEKFSFHYTDHFKTGRELVHMLLDVVSKGGNLALNIAPQPDGELPKPAVDSMKDLGRWLSMFGEGIYETSIIPPYFQEQIRYTKKPSAIYAFYLYKEKPCLPPILTLDLDTDIREIRSMRTGEVLPYKQENGRIKLYTESLCTEQAFYAEGFCIDTVGH